MATLSLVITAHNCERFVERAIESAFNQAKPFKEVIAIDDASGDKTFEILRRLKKEFPTLGVFRNETNRERCFSRNRGAELSSGEFVCFLDCDDFLGKTYAEGVLNILETSKVDAVFQNPKGFISPKGQIKLKKKRKESFEELLFGGEVGYPSGSCFRRESFLNLGGYLQKYLHREDWEIFLRFYLKGLRVAYNPAGDYFIGVHGGRSSAGNPKFLEATLEVVEDYLPLIPKEYRGYTLHHAAVQCFRFKNRRCGFRYLKKLLEENPKVLLNGRRFWELFKRIWKI